MSSKMTAPPGSHVTLDLLFPSSLHPRAAAAMLQGVCYNAEAESLGTLGHKLPSAQSQRVSIHPEDGVSAGLLEVPISSVLRDCLNRVAGLERWLVG